MLVLLSPNKKISLNIIRPQRMSEPDKLACARVRPQRMPNVRYADLFVKLQREARQAGKGLWGACPGCAASA